ncbi:acyl carrier protein phosphodiesterase [Salegentibacter chungangensis]|uniref:ACP phosphodiesterase n=1 Tax=Salegentibacter chungangensis TaxID=1335724 RepID=A0ABW3NRM4_9FLAO
MNYLAHIYLSGEDDELKIGNFIADSVKGKEYLDFPERIAQGIVLHRAIDDFTDSHPVFKKSTGRLFNKYGHYSRVIVDILYDHFLAANWDKYSETPLEVYSEEFYDLLNENSEILPERVQYFLPFMVRDNWLLSYASIEGIGRILNQMSRRTEFKSRMNLATEDLKLYYSEFEDDFFRFFGELQDFCEQEIGKL